MYFYTKKNQILIDKDLDGLSNLAEKILQTSPDCADSDNDGMPDLYELMYGFNPKDKKDAFYNADNDGLSNLEEYLKHTNPLDADTDDDGLSDKWDPNPNKSDTLFNISIYIEIGTVSIIFISALLGFIEKESDSIDSIFALMILNTIIFIPTIIIIVALIHCSLSAIWYKIIIAYGIFLIPAFCGISDEDNDITYFAYLITMGVAFFAVIQLFVTC